MAQELIDIEASFELDRERISPPLRTLLDSIKILNTRASAVAHGVEQGLADFVGPGSLQSTQERLKHVGSQAEYILFVLWNIERGIVREIEEEEAEARL